MANVIIGNPNIESINDGATMDHVCGTRFQVNQNCTLKTLSFYCGSSGPNAILAVYSDNNGAPGDLLSQSDPVAVAAGWTTVTVPAISLAAEQYIWLSWIFDSSITGTVFGTFGGHSEDVPLGVNPTGYKSASKFQMLDVEGATLEKLTCLLLPAASGTNALMAVYADDSGVPGALLGVSSEVSLTNSVLEWQDFLFTPLALTANAFYWFALISDNTISLRCADADTVNFVYNQNQYSSGFTNPYGAVLGGNNTVASVYATISAPIGAGDGWRYKAEGESFHMWNPYVNGLPASLSEGYVLYDLATYSIYATAETTAVTYDLTVSASAGGSVTPQGTTSYPAGMLVDIFAVPETPGFHFDHWTKDGQVLTEPNPTLTIMMDSNHNVIATFTANEQPHDCWLWWLIILAAAGGTAVYLNEHQKEKK